MQTDLANFAIALSASLSPFAFGAAARTDGAPAHTENLETARLFLAAIELDCTRDAEDLTNSADAYYSDEVLQEEFPNRFVPAGAQRNRTALREAAVRGRKVMRSQRFEPRSAHAVGNMVILEVLWVGTLSVDIGALAAGDEMRAHFAVFLEFRDGLIVRHRTYDCFEPF